MLPLWFFPALLGLCAFISLAAGTWLVLHMQDVVRIFSGKHPGNNVPEGPRRPIGRTQVWWALILFNAGWVTCVLILVFAMSGEANQATNAAA